MNYSYHNTTDVVGQELNKYDLKATNQDDRLLEYFMNAFTRDGSYVLLTPTAALKRVFDNRIPITSVRRALSNLTRDGKLQKSGKTRGPYGRPEHYWRLVPQQPQQEMF